MNYSGIINCSIVDGNGFRVALYVSGCSHHCKNCHNENTWNPLSGKPYTDAVEDVLFDRLDNKFIKGLTLTGGDPLHDNNLETVKHLISKFREVFGNAKDIWIYSGYTLSELDAERKEIVAMCDYFVDGRFDINKLTRTAPFKGSSNQTIWKIVDSEFVESEYNN